jgi:hypothetical protein
MMSTVTETVWVFVDIFFGGCYFSGPQGWDSGNFPRSFCKWRKVAIFWLNIKAVCPVDVEQQPTSTNFASRYYIWQLSRTEKGGADQ